MNVKSSLALALFTLVPLALTTPAVAGDGDVVVSTKNYSVTESHLENGKVRYVWLTKDNDTGSANTLKAAKKAAKDALNGGR
jgi:hypothetical protein